VQKSSVIALLLLKVIVGMAATADSIAPSIEIKPSYYVLPYLNYQPETSWAPGVSGAYYFGSRDLSKISSLVANYTITFKGQSIINFTPRLFLANNQWLMYANFSYRTFPNQFYGVGAKPDGESVTYTYNNMETNVQMQYIFSNKFYVGAIIDCFSNLSPNKGAQTVDSIFASPVFTNVEGLYAYTNTSFGVVGAYDSRDNQFYPHGGTFLKMTFTRSQKGVLSDYSVGELSLDYRKYWMLAADHILCVQYLYDGLVSNGAIPFQLMPTLGGMDVMRGLRQGMYINRQMMVAQVEYRLPVYQKLKAAVFTSFGNVYDKELIPPSLIMSGGAGLRYQYNKARVNFRLDVAVNNYDLHPQVYLTATEAF
jgi:outer membrane protein assembly factor BamA